MNERNTPRIKEQKPPKRPFAVSILVVLVLFFTTINGVRSYSAINSWELIIDLVPRNLLIYIIASGFIWGVVGLLLSVGIFFRKKWSLIIMRIAVPLYLLYFWIDRLFIAEHDYIYARWQFYLGLTVLILVFYFWILRREKTKKYLNK
jgi:hypothetical protein